MKTTFLTIPFLLSAVSARTLYSERSVRPGILPRQTSDNLQTFTGNLGVAAVPITNSGDAKRPFEVNGDTFVNFGAAAQRTCDVQFNGCANQANSGASFSVDDCQTQKTACDQAQQSAPVQSFTGSAAAADSGAASTGTAAAAASASTGSSDCATAKKIRRTRHS
ncbi:MAG: hypothetical protein Q9227_002653 [Pyrenula ochraceoflavens]